MEARALYSLIQWCQVYQIFVFHLFYCNLKEKDPTRGKTNNKKKTEKILLEEKPIIVYMWNSIIILICQKISLLG